MLVTGSSGFVGSALVPALAQAGYIVRAASRSRRSVTNVPGLEWMPLPDLAEPVDWGPLLKEVDAVIHLAALAHRRSSDPRQYAFVNYQATAHLVRACKKFGTSRFIFMSSIAAQVGSAAEGIVHESDAPRPATAYDRSKLAAEEAVRSAGVPSTILRPVIIYGPGAKGNVATLRKIAALPVPLPFGSFSNRRSMLAIDNLIDALIFCLHHPETIDRTFIVADPQPITLPEMISALREGMGRPRWLVAVPPLLFKLGSQAIGREYLWDRLGRDLVVSSAELQALGWKPRVQTREGLCVITSRSSMRRRLRFARRP